MVSVRAATLEDVDAIVGMGAEAHAESPNYQSDPYDPERVAELAHQLIPTGGVFVAMAGAITIGMGATLTFPHYATGVLTGTDVILYVRPTSRGLRGAVKLVRAMEAWAKGRGAVKFSMVPANGYRHERTVRLLQRLGYKIDGTTMSKRLPP